MAEYNCTINSEGIFGIMPSGEVWEFETEQDYFESYWSEVDEIVDEMARLDEDRRLYEHGFEWC